MLLWEDPGGRTNSPGFELSLVFAHSVDRATIDDRSDVAVYTSAPLAAPMRLMGPVAAELFVAADRPNHDLDCTLSVLLPDGTAMALTGGHLRIEDATKKGPHRIAMRATCTTVPAGAALRLSVQAAAWPAFAVKPGIGKRPEESSFAEAQVPAGLAWWAPSLRQSIPTFPPSSTTQNHGRA